MDFAYDLPQWAFGIHVANTAVALLTFVPAVYYAVVIRHHLIYLTAQATGWVMNALIPPLFLVTCFETGYVIHKERSVRYLGINFDEGKRVDTTPCSWFLRYIIGLVAVLILAITLLVNFARFFSKPSARAGMAGYIALGNPDTAHFYTSLVPAYVLSIVSIFIGVQIKRYGTHSTLLIRQSYGWNLMLVGAIIQCAGQFPAQMSIYPVTSMLGQTILLVCVVLTHREVYRDLTEADKISDFLRRQTLAQQRLAAQPKPQRGAHAKHHHHHHRHHESGSNNHHHRSITSGEKLGVATDGGGLELGQVAIEMVPVGPAALVSDDSKKSEEGAATGSVIPAVPITGSGGITTMSAAVGGAAMGLEVSSL